MIRTTIHFFLIGGALLVLDLVSEVALPPERPRIAVTVPPAATEVEIAASIDEEILVAEALRYGWLYNDPVIRQQLVRNMRFVQGEDDVQRPPPEQEAALLEQAIALGMHRTDPVVRQRLVFRVHSMADTAASAEAPDDDDLRAHLEAHPERFARPARYHLSQVFLSGERRRDDLEADGRTLAERLHHEPPETAHRLGDPFLHPLGEQTLTEAGLDQRFGPGFGAQVRRARPGRWEGPLRSSYGLHFLWVHEVVPGEVPALEEVRDQVTRSLVHDRRHGRRAAHVQRLRASYVVRVHRVEARR